MWQQICLINRENVSRLLADYIESLTEVKGLLDCRKDEELYTLFENARIYRDSFIDSPNGPIKVSYSLNVDIADEPGALASIATILALNNISIKNIGILHNREREEGVLGIEFHDEPSLLNATKILNAKSYLLHEKKK
jgi:prephenate dehydrogenase